MCLAGLVLTSSSSESNRRTGAAMGGSAVTFAEKPWHRIFVRALSVVNLVQVFAGLSLVAVDFLFHSGDYLRVHPAHVAYYSMQFLNLLFLAAIAIGSIWLWRFQPRGLLICNIAFVSELGYWLAIEYLQPPPLIWSAHTPAPDLAFAQARALANMGLAPQIYTLYPIIALILLNAFKLPTPS